ncbi:uncharacterized protein LOC144112985 [Amblyomma americanum]
MSDSESLDTDEELQESLAKGELKPGLYAIAPHVKKEFINNTAALKQKLAEMELDLDWVETLTMVNGLAPLTPELSEQFGDMELQKNRKGTVVMGSNEDPVHHDFKREMAFYRQAQAAVLEGIPRLHQLGVVTRRPDDYFAQMAKSDTHMTKVREKLLTKKVALERSEKARKLRELKKFGKKIVEGVAVAITEHGDIAQPILFNRNGEPEHQPADEPTFATIPPFASGAAHVVATLERGEELDDGLIAQAAISRKESYVPERESTVVTDAFTPSAACAFDTEQPSDSDYVVLSNFWAGCTRAPPKEDPEYEIWLSNHDCQKNTYRKSGLMEVEAAVTLFERSLSRHGLRYSVMLCDGDSRPFNAIQEASVYGYIPVRKEDCVNHVKKRMGTALCNILNKHKGRGQGSLDFLENTGKQKGPKPAAAGNQPGKGKRLSKSQLKRQYKDKKYGYGGQRKRSKFNTASSSADVEGFSRKKHNMAPGAGKKRPGKARRQNMKNKQRRK